MGFSQHGTYSAVSAQLADGIVSNDKLGSNIAIGGYIIVPVYFTDAVGQGTWATSADTNCWTCSKINNNVGTADGDNFTIKVYLGAGTFTLTELHKVDTNCGKLDIYIDATKVVSLTDHYAAGAAANVSTQTAGIVVATNGVKNIKCQVNGKNGASSSYQMPIEALVFTRTA